VHSWLCFHLTLLIFKTWSLVTFSVYKHEAEGAAGELGKALGLLAARVVAGVGGAGA